ncbi:MAG TPA: ABC transporter permease [Mycobacteriales bacterium]|nr:ABC transporter permease [Mycobacteriales bacterium]
MTGPGSATDPADVTRPGGLAGGTAAEVDLALPAEEGGGRGREVVRRLRRSPSAVLGLVLVGLFVLVGVFAPLLAPYSPTFVDLTDIRPGDFPGPSREHLLGVDNLGRDVFSRILYGARYSLVIGVVSVLIGASAGTVLGLLAGAFGGWVDGVVMRLVDIMLAVPSLLAAIGIAALLGRSLTSVMIAIGVVNVPIFARLLRGAMLSQRESDYALAATSLGVKRWRVTLQHVFPNSLAPVIVQGTLALATAIIDAAGLAFLGLGAQDPRIPEWGRMLADAQLYLASEPLLALWPGLAIMISVLGFYLFGEALREALDPKLRR